MKLEEGMYVRTKKGTIHKIFEIDKMLKYEKEDRLIINEDNWFLVESDLVKASHNIVDLIEVGDVITTNNLCGQVTHVEGDKIYTTCYDGEYCYDYQIQSILTKEQFESMKYEVK